MLLQELSSTILAKYTAGSRKTFPGTGNKKIFREPAAYFA